MLTIFRFPQSVCLSGLSLKLLSKYEVANVRPSSEAPPSMKGSTLLPVSLPYLCSWELNVFFRKSFKIPIVNHEIILLEFAKFILKKN